jgi:hypothetical protein
MDRIMGDLQLGTTKGLRRAGAAGSAAWPSLNARLSHEERVSAKTWAH